jgi:hypothetical protein
MLFIEHWITLHFSERQIMKNRRMIRLNSEDHEASRSPSDLDPLRLVDSFDSMNEPNNLRYLVAVLLVILTTGPSVTISFADVPPGSEPAARKYYRSTSKALGFSTPDLIFQTTLDDVASYLGYAGVTGADLQNLPPEVLMNTQRLLAPSALPNREVVIASLASVPFQPNDILVTRFFAPKIMDIKQPPETRKNGWRKLVRLKARPGSLAARDNISSGIILFNFFTEPGASPFAQGSESVNTQVMLVTELSHVPGAQADGPDTLYWLDYDQLSKGGLLSLALHASFDSNELPPAANDTKAYFVPDGCAACHGANSHRSMVNYLDTDHWFDRIENDFTNMKTNGLALLVDAKTNDTNSLDYILAFDVIRRFNAEADELVQKAQPTHDEALASKKWLALHATSVGHFVPVERAIGKEPRWSAQNPDDAKTLDLLNQYCFRCHGTVKFSVFNRQAMATPEMKTTLEQRLKADAAVGVRMPPDRPLPDDARSLVLRVLIP